MKSTDDRKLFTTLIGADAASGDIVVIPATQTTPGDGTASIADGFPAETFISTSAGGKRPRGQDVNGFLNLLSSAARVLQAENFGPYSSALSAAIGGYPLNAVVSAGTAGAFWVSTVEDNTTVPGNAGASWQSLFYGLAPLASPTFTGVPTVPTPAAGTNNTQAANTAWTKSNFAALNGSAGQPFNASAYNAFSTSSPANVGSFLLVGNSGDGHDSVVLRTDGANTHVYPWGVPVGGLHFGNSTGFPVTFNGQVSVTPATGGNEAVAYSQLFNTSLVPSFASAQVNTPSSNDDSRTVPNTSWFYGGAMNAIANALGFAFNGGSPGYIKFPNWLGGFIIQWGDFNVPNDTTQTGNYAIAFPNTMIKSVCAFGSAIGNQFACGIDPLNNSQYTIRVQGTAGGSNNVHWIAVGY